MRHTALRLLGLKNARISKGEIIFRALNPTSNRALLYPDRPSQTVTYRTYITAIKRFIAKAEEGGSHNGTQWISKREHTVPRSEPRPPPQKNPIPRLCLSSIRLSIDQSRSHFLERIRPPAAAAFWTNLVPRLKSPNWGVFVCGAGSSRSSSSRAGAFLSLSLSFFLSELPPFSISWSEHVTWRRRTKPC